MREGGSSGGGGGRGGGGVGGGGGEGRGFYDNPVRLNGSSTRGMNPNDAHSSVKITRLRRPCAPFQRFSPLKDSHFFS